MARKELSDQDLRRFALWFAMHYLEVERGLRDRRWLQRYMAGDAYQRQRTDAASRFGKAGIVTQADIASITLNRPTPHHAFVTMTAKQQSGRWGALLLELQADARGAWRVTELTRAQDRNLSKAPEEAAARSQDVAAEDRTSRHVWQDVHAALRTAEDRYARAIQEYHALAPKRPVSYVREGDTVNVGTMTEQCWITVDQIGRDGATGEVTLRGRDRVRLSAAADRVVAVMDAASGDVEAGRHAMTRLGPVLRSLDEEVGRWRRQADELMSRWAVHEDARGVDARTPVTADWMEHLKPIIGERPDGPHGRLWDWAAHAVDAYRRRWNIDSDVSALGGAATTTDQAAERRRVVEKLRDLQVVLDAVAGAEPDRSLAGGDATPTRDRGAPDLTR